VVVEEVVVMLLMKVELVVPVVGDQDTGQIAQVLLIMVVLQHNLLNQDNPVLMVLEMLEVEVEDLLLHNYMVVEVVVLAVKVLEYQVLADLIVVTAVSEKHILSLMELLLFTMLVVELVLRILVDLLLVLSVVKVAVPLMDRAQAHKLELPIEVVVEVMVHQVEILEVVVKE
jgi:hypothetical protein